MFETMVNGKDIIETVKRLYWELKRPDSIEEVAQALGMPVAAILEAVSRLLEMGILEGSMDSLQPGPTNGLLL